MAKSPAERPSFTFTKGLMTDANLVTFPPDFSVDELNYELLLDGTRRRRRGLESEGGSDILGQAEAAPVRTFKWKAVGDDPSLNFHCWQIGDTVYFADDVPTPSASMRAFTLGLVGLATTGHEADAGLNPIDMAFGRGQAVVVGKYLNPSLVTYDALTDALVITPIDIKERDFQGVEDGIDNVTFPTVLSDAYSYNMINSGWAYGDIVLYEAEKNEYPAKNMVYYQGFRRATVVGFDPADGTRQFSSDKLVAELFQDAPAPKGHFVRSPFDTSINLEVDFETIANKILSWVPANPNNLNLPHHTGPALNYMTATFESPPSLSVGETFCLRTSVLGRIGSPNSGGDRYWQLGQYNVPLAPDNAVVEALGPGPNDVQFYVEIGPDDSTGWHNAWPYSYYPQTFVYTGGDTLDIAGRVIEERPTATAFFAGRAWYSGIENPILSSALYFSQIIEVDAQYGKCYQVADPTDENISDLLPTDGGVLRIPEMGKVYRLMPFSSSLLVFASNGVWEIGPGSSGYFTATAYSVRKITDIQCVNAASVAWADGIPVFWAKSGIFALSQDTNTGFLTAESITAQKIDTLYGDLGEAVRATASADYDRINKRIVWVYQEGTQSKALVFDVKFQAFTTWTFGTRIADIFTTSDYDTSNRTTLRFITRSTTHQVVIPTSLSFADLGGATGAYLVTGYDTAGTPARRKKAPVITVFQKRTEQLSALGVINESSLTLQARWDWSDNSVAGKWGTSQQVYRHPRPFTLVTDIGVGPVFDGAPLVVTRNKLRGRGRSLHLYFSAGSTNDSHILGWSTNFEILTEV